MVTSRIQVCVILLYDCVCEHVRLTSVTVANERYFGAARELPGVKELFEERKRYAEEGEGRPHKRHKADIYRNIDASYYGFKTEHDSELEQQEQEASEKARQREEMKYRELHGHAGDVSRRKTVVAGDRIAAHARAMTEIRVPTQDDIERALLEKRKRELLQRL